MSAQILDSAAFFCPGSSSEPIPSCGMASGYTLTSARPWLITLLAVIVASLPDLLAYFLRKNHFPHEWHKVNAIPLCVWPCRFNFLFRAGCPSCVLHEGEEFSPRVAQGECTPSVSMASLFPPISPYWLPLFSTAHTRSIPLTSGIRWTLPLCVLHSQFVSFPCELPCLHTTCRRHFVLASDTRCSVCCSS